MESITTEILALLLFAAFCGGFVDSIAGGGGLICLPALVAAGLPPAEALATNKLQGTFGTLSSTINYAQKGHVNLREMGQGIAFTFVGSALGTLAVQVMDQDLLKQVIPFLLIGAALYFVFGHQASEEDRQQRMEPLPFYFLIGTSCGFYDGFFGPGTGSFFTLAFVALLGFNLIKATAHTKVLNLTSNVASLMLFAYGGFVIWSIGLVMALGQFTGARLGSHMAMTHGAKLIRPILVTVSVVMTAKIIYDSPDNIVHQGVKSLLGL